MRRLLPAHVLGISAAGGLAFANAVRLEPSVDGAVLAGAAACAAVVLLRGHLVAVACFLVLVAWWWASVRLDALDRSPLRTEIGRAGRALVVVTGAPRPGTFVQRAPAHVITFDGRHIGERAELELALGRSPPQGAILEVLAVVRAPRGPSNGFDERAWLRRQGIHVVFKVDEWTVTGHRHGVGAAADTLGRWLAADSAPGVTGERRAVIEGILLGDDGQLGYGLKTSFQRSGLYHLLAVSGQNVVLLAAGVLGLCWLFGVPRAVGHVGALAAIGGYVLAVGPQPSVIRAAVSGTAVSIAWLLGRQRDSWQVLLLAAVELLAWDPYMLFDAGFQLSFAAVVAIFVLAGPLLELLEGVPGSPWLRKVVAISTACSVMTAPLLWLQFGRVPLLGVVANALAEAVVGPLLALAFAAAVVAPVAPSLAHLLAWLNGWLAAYIAGCARAVSAVPFAQVSGRAAAGAAGLLVVGAAYAWRRWQTTSRPPI